MVTVWDVSLRSTHVVSDMTGLVEGRRHAKVTSCGGKRGHFCKCRDGTKFACTVASDRAILPSSCHRQLWSTDRVIIMREKNVSV